MKVRSPNIVRRLAEECQVAEFRTPARDLAIHSPGLAERIGTALVKRRRKQSWLASQAGVSAATISTVIGTERVTRAMGARLSEVLGVPLPDLVPEFSAAGQGAQAWEAPASASSMPRELRAMALRFLAEANEAGADEGFLRYAKHSLEDPELATLYAGGLDEEGRPMTAEEQRDDYEAVIDGLRLIMKRRLARARAHG